MNITARELKMATVTLLVILAGGAYWLGIPRYRSWRRAGADIKRVEHAIEQTQRLLQGEERWQRRLDELLLTLPLYQPDEKVTAEVLRLLEAKSRRHQLTLLRREPQPEEKLGELYQVSIRCSWEGTIDSLVHFLYDVQQEGAILDIRQMRITPDSRREGMLRGGFTVAYAYCRGARDEDGPDS